MQPPLVDKYLRPQSCGFQPPEARVSQSSRLSLLNRPQLYDDQFPVYGV